MIRITKNITPFLLGFAILIYLFNSLITFNQIEEDAFIYFRAAQNIFEGHGYVFNHGSSPVETGSSIIWQLITALLFFLPSDITVSTKYLGIILGCLSLVVVYSIASKTIRSKPLCWTAVYLTAVSNSFIMSNQRGLETPLYTLIFLLLVTSCLNKRRSKYWLILISTAIFTRSEGFILILGLTPHFIFHRKPYTSLARDLLIIGTVLCFIEIFRLCYFHDYLSTPFYLKLGLNNITTGMNRVVIFLREHHLYYFSGPFLIAIFLPSFWQEKIITLLSFTIVIALWCSLANDWKPYFRHLLPAIPLAYIIILASVDFLIRRTQMGTNIFISITSLCFCTAFLCYTAYGTKAIGYHNKIIPNPVVTASQYFFNNPLKFLNGFLQKNNSPYKKTYLDSLSIDDRPIGTNQHSLIGDFIRINYPRDISIIYDQMGQTPFRAGSDKKFIDSFGLVDKELGYYYFSQRFERSLVLKAYNFFLTQSVNLINPEWRQFITTRKRALDYLFHQDADLLMVHLVVAHNRNSLAYHLIKAPDTTQRYVLKYYIYPYIIVYEKREKETNSILLPMGLDVENIKNDPVFQRRLDDYLEAPIL